MESYLPYTTKPEDIKNLLLILAPKIKGATLTDLKMINKDVDENAVNSCVFLQLIKLQSENYILTEDGRELSQSPDDSKTHEILRGIIKRIQIYDLTLEYLHHNTKYSPSKVEIGGYWHEYFTQIVKDYDDETLSSAVIFYLKLLDWAGLGKYIFAGKGRQTRIDLDVVELAKYVVSTAAPVTTERPDASQTTASEQTEKKKDDIQDSSTPEKPIEEDEYISSLRALKKLNIELTWKDLDSDGAKKLIIDKLDELKGENTVLNAKVEKYQKLEKHEAVLVSKVKSLSKVNFYKTGVNSIGGVIVGASIALTDNIYKVIGVVMGLCLVVLSFIITEKSDDGEIEE